MYQILFKMTVTCLAVLLTNKLQTFRDMVYILKCIAKFVTDACILF